MLVYLLPSSYNRYNVYFCCVFVCLVAWWSTTPRIWIRKRSTARCAASPKPSRASATAARRTWMSQSDGRARGTTQWVINFSYCRIFLNILAWKIKFRRFKPQSNINRWQRCSEISCFFLLLQMYLIQIKCPFLRCFSVPLSLHFGFFVNKLLGDKPICMLNSGSNPK